MTALPSPSAVDAATRVVALRTQHGPGLLGVPRDGLRLSWRAETGDAGARIEGYQLAEGVEGATLTASEPVASTRITGVAIPGSLAPRERRAFAVRVATATGWTAWSEPLVVEAGVDSADLEAAVIGTDTPADGPVPLLRTEFALDRVPASARLRLSALGLVDAWINGTPATDALLTPGWTSYQERILVDTIDVTPLLREGANVIVLAVADGWYRGSFGFARRQAIYGDRTGALAQLEADGETVAKTDASWQAGFGPLRSASIYDGTVTDLRLDDPAVHEPGFAADGWRAASVIDVDTARFVPRSAPPVRVVAELPMDAIAHDGRTRLDGGQNVSGWVRLTVRGRAGDVVTVRHAEVLEPSGDLHVKALRSAKATDVYTLDRDGEHTLEPAFTFHGFRYADVDGAEVVSATAVAISSDLAPRSTFTSSHEALDRFHSNVFWSQRDNFVSVPTDCPQRDERLGWTGDAQAFAATANTLMDTEAFWLSWLRDLEIDQTDEGGVPAVVPDIIRPQDMLMGGVQTPNMGRAGWADAATIIPLAVYESYGSDEVLRRQRDSMRRWVDHLTRRAGDHVVLAPGDYQFGDWLDPDAPGDRPWEAKVSSDFVSNAFYAHSARLLAHAERILGDAATADRYDALADRVGAATFERWGDEAVLTQSGAAIALEFGLAPTARRAEIADGLAENVRRENGRIATGFLGTPLVLFALSRSGHLDEAYLMLLRSEAPSWLYQVDRGATTVWERWDAILPDGSIHSGAMDALPTEDASEDDTGMLSFNHYAYGAMIDWVYRTVAGLAPDADDPGYRTVHVAPRPAVGLSHASASIDTPQGRLAIDWRVDGGVFEAALEVPFGSRAMLDLPITAESTATVGDAPAPAELRHGTHRIVVTAPAVAAPGAVVPA
ncbi:family 78 glycoside hydrolase catalytic domain [Microbacterium sp. QXD-8]|uniref:alpha-L-rhamnosidase n=1 Tax=Microbacterium psychrotolerans TaxID=3068321 RepID=A0ABU0Z5X4_9MICO|nr:family 78 glycoside hydrolase catalytic domain [Microbacterium sp. QXD-8]MDQ7879194.1 family 78 glycoside hydrolase catalytic domain [Microbacterium sp. QXD-8]